MKAFRLRIRTFLIAVAALAILLAWVGIPAWDYYCLPPSTRSVLARLGRPLRLTGSRRLEGLLKSVRLSSVEAKSGVGIPIYVDPDGLAEAKAALSMPINPAMAGKAIAQALDGSLRPLRLGYYVEDGLLKITSAKAAEQAIRERPGSARRP